MGHPNSHDAHPSARALWERAELSGSLRVGPMTRGQAVRLRGQLHTVRARQADRSVKIFPPDHPMFGHSPWDGYEVLIAEADGKFICPKCKEEHDTVWLVISTGRFAQEFTVEELDVSG